MTGCVYGRQVCCSFNSQGQELLPLPVCHEGWTLPGCYASAQASWGTASAVALQETPAPARALQPALTMGSLSLWLWSSQFPRRIAFKRHDGFSRDNIGPSCSRSWSLKPLNKETELCSWILMGSRGLLLQRYHKGEFQKETVKEPFLLGGGWVKTDRVQHLPNNVISYCNPFSSLHEILFCLSFWSFHLHSLASC